MASQGWLVIPALVALSAAAFAACSDVAPTTTTGTASSTSSGMGGAGGAGGAPGTTGTTGTTSTSTGATEDAGPLTCKSHTYSTIKTGPCDLLAQNCPEGQTCKETVGDDGKWTSYCAIANGLKGEGEKCAVDEECLARLTCAVGRCAPVCCAATNAPCLGGLCNLYIQFDSTMKANKQVCHYAKACALLTESACELGFDCHVEDKKQGLATCIKPSGAKVPDLGACKFLNDCADMEHCHKQGSLSTGKCHFYCSLGQTDPASPGASLGGCPAGQTCQTNVDGFSLDPEFILSLPEIGLCAPGGSSTSSTGGG